MKKIIISLLKFISYFAIAALICIIYIAIYRYNDIVFAEPRKLSDFRDFLGAIIFFISILAIPVGFLVWRGVREKEQKYDERINLLEKQDIIGKEKVKSIIRKRRYSKVILLILLVTVPLTGCTIVFFKDYKDKEFALEAAREYIETPIPEAIYYRDAEYTKIDKNTYKVKAQANIIKGYGGFGLSDFTIEVKKENGKRVVSNFK